MRRRTQSAYPLEKSENEKEQKLKKLKIEQKFAKSKTKILSDDEYTFILM
jgi:hypothetical protein